ncbi:hypothetical protein B0T19DRAFT_411353 [Cercophora scortea]|uniref:Dihydroneopterin aldolase/epimerase domain-containing protein n=1 Tax=Cercophora scortea TaxID=314031 RepID=A0AAE0J5R1_9PEZI|nr:hypothetical protein B0T19DRAFT_411353 [Cercophora scortea]
MAFPDSFGTLSTSWDVRASAGEPVAVVRVQNLQAVINGPQDAWGRQCKPQPALISAEVSFNAPFDTAATDDRLGADTLHYGNLSKAILASLDDFSPGDPALPPDVEHLLSLRRCVDVILVHLTGAYGRAQTSLISPERVRFLSITVCLPKASLLGEGVSITQSCVFGATGGEFKPAKYAVALSLNKLRVPTLVGVNANERLSKQFVVTTITIDQCDIREDVYTKIEDLVVKALEASSFETLEALGAHLADKVLSSDLHDGSQVHVKMEKPTAVPLADCPIVEVRATKP